MEDNGETNLFTENIKNEVQNYSKNPDHLFSCERCTPEQYLCPRCYFKTDLIQDLKNHKLNHRADIDTSEKFHFSIYKCEMCNFQTSSVLVVTKHISASCAKTTQPNLTSKSPLTKWHNCDQCPYKTQHFYRLDRHRIRKHTKDEDIEWHRCDLCPFKAKTGCGLRTHARNRHTRDEDIKWFECDQCPFRSKRSKGVQMHVIARHAADDAVEWFECGRCPYRTKCKGNLNKHVLVMHTDLDKIQWFCCEECGYRGKTKRHLKRHLRSHLAEEEIERFECGTCGYKFKDKRHLRKHIVRKHFEKNA